MRVLVLTGFLALSACGGGGTTGTNYSDAPPMAEIVATPTPKASETPEPTPEPSETPTPETELVANESNATAD